MARVEDNGKERSFVITSRAIYLWAAALLLLCYCVSLASLIGDIGFQGDDWWVFAFPFWNSFPDALSEYTRESRRPVEGLYWISMFEIFRFERTPYNLLSLLLLAGSGMAMGACLLKAFPGRIVLAVSGVLFAFLLPPLSNLTYMIHTDNSRISTLFFWVSVAAFQRWASGSRSWPALALPVLLYTMATLTYENTTLLILVVPGFVWPVLRRQEAGLPAGSLMARLGIAIACAFALFVALRFWVFSGGAVRHGSLVPSTVQALSYFGALMDYLLVPFANISTDAGAWAWGLVVALTSCVLLVWCDRNAGSRVPSAHPRCEESGWYVALLGVMVLLLGVAPYLLAGYDAALGFTSQSRVFSSGAFGVAILLGLLTDVLWRGEKKRLVVKSAVAVLMAFLAVFLADLRKEWQNAAVKRNDLCASLLKQVPAVSPGTTFLFLDLQWYLDDRAVVFQGVDGLPDFVRILYHQKDLYGYFLYTRTEDFVNAEARTAVASPQGLAARGSAVRGLVPLDSLLILRRVGSTLVLVNRISRDRNEVAIDWRGIDELRSNRNLIVGRASGGSPGVTTKTVPRNCPGRP